MSKNHNADQWFLIPVLLILFGFSFYGFFLHDELRVPWLDRLDGVIPTFKLLAESDLYFTLKGTLEQPLGGIPRFTLLSFLKAMVWPFVWFDPIHAYLINRLLVILIAFCGMYYLLKKHFDVAFHHPMILAGTSLCFALTPFYYLFGISVAGYPLLLSVFLDLSKNRVSKFHFAILLLFAIYTLFSVSGFFYLAYWFLGVLLLILWRKSFFYPLIGGLFLLLAYLVADHGLFYGLFFDSDFVTHRVEFTRYGNWPFSKVMKNTWNVFFNESYFSALAGHKLVILWLVPVGLVVALINNFSRLMQILGLLLLCFVLSFLIGFWDWQGLKPIKNILPPLNYVDMSRFHWALPMLWNLILATCLVAIIEWRAWTRFLLPPILALQVFFLLNHDVEISQRIRSVTGNPAITWLMNRTRAELYVQPLMNFSFKSFYAKELFDQVAKKIDAGPNARTIALGLQPSVTIYNGFYTVDGYFSNYDLKYKHRFRKIVAPELEKSKSLRDNFDGWGSRVYFYSNEILGRRWWATYNWTKDRNGVVKDLQFDADAFRDLGGRYVISAVKIENHQSQRLRFVEKFTHPDSAWDVYLYEL